MKQTINVALNGGTLTVSRNGENLMALDLMGARHTVPSPRRLRPPATHCHTLPRAVAGLESPSAL